MRRDAVAIALVFILLGSLGTYMILGSENNDESDDQIQDDRDGLSDDWDVYYVQTGDELPTCGSDTLGRLYYVASHSGFETCTTTGWMFVDLRGAVGPAGPAGVNGTDGADGVDGADGSASINTMLTSIAEPTREDCSLGGRVVSEGLDNGDMDFAAYAEDFTVEEVGLNLTIPDNNETGVNSTIDLTDVDGLIDQIEIFVNISHGWISDLIITLTTPNGQELVLWEIYGGQGFGGIVDWVGSEQLSSLQGQDIAGEWVLNIEDDDASIDGVLNSWLIRHENTTVMSYPANGVLEFEEVDYLTTYCSRYVAEMIIDVNYGTGSTGSSEFIGVLGDSVYNGDFYGSPEVFFRGSAHKGLMGYNPLNDSVWETDSSVKDISDLTQSYGGEIYYKGDDDDGECGLYRYDVVFDRTDELGDICPLEIYYDYGSYWEGDDVIWFSGRTGTTGYELMAIDPLQSLNDTGWVVADINPGTGSSIPRGFQGIEGDVYFRAKADGQNYELWGVNKVNNSYWKASDTDISSDPVWSDDYPDWLFFTSSQIIRYDSSTGDPIVEDQIWAYSVTNGSTWMITNVSGGDVSSPVIAGDRIYFVGYRGFQSLGLWTYNITSANGSAWILHNSEEDYGEIAVSGDLVFFVGGTMSWFSTQVSGSLWIYNQAIDEFSMVYFERANPAVHTLGVVNGELYFTALSQFGREVFNIEIETEISFEEVN